MSQRKILSTQFIKLKVQGLKKDVLEFEERLNRVMIDLDCQVFDQTPPLRNKETNFFRKFIFIGMNRRDGSNGKKKTN